MKWRSFAVIIGRPDHFSTAMRRSLPLFCAAAFLSGCATLTDSTEQTVLVQTVLDNRAVANVGCLLTNQAGKWFVNAPGRVTIARNAGPLAVDCRDGATTGYDVVASKLNPSGLWGNLIVSAGLGYYVDKNTGAGFDYPSTLTIVLHGAPPPTPEPPADPGGAQIY